MNFSNVRQLIQRRNAEFTVSLPKSIADAIVARTVLAKFRKPCYTIVIRRMERSGGASDAVTKEDEALETFRPQLET